jgi:hypothetical protein
VNTINTDHYAIAASCYISHWFNDLYYSIRKAVKAFNPIAFTEKYHHENAQYADRYDPFLTLLMNAIKPTPIVGAIADEVYIPILAKNIDFSKKRIIEWVHWNLDQTLFNTIHQTLELKKIVKMTPPSEDTTGRASWLLDWPDNRTAYAWFPMEGNYNEIDLAVAYILGVACTPKISMPDTDEWRMYTSKTNVKNIDVNSYVRLSNRKRFGTSEFRTLEAEEVVLPNYYESDSAKFSKMNIGALKIHKISTDTDEETSEQPDDDYVPESPRPFTRSQAEKDAPSMALRVRVHDYPYYMQVIDKLETSTRYAAFKLINPPPPSSH